MRNDELLELISEIRQHQSEMDDVEVKSAQQGTPQRLFEPLSAFANSARGGVLLFGLREDSNYEIVGEGNAQRLQEEISHLAASEMEPPLRPAFTIESIEGRSVLTVEITPLPVDQKPCYYRPAGLQRGSYIRVGNTNRQMTDYEVFGYVSARAQPMFDEEPVQGATLDDLDKTKLDDYLAQLRQARRQAPYLRQPLDQVLSQLRIVQIADGVPRPTLAGLLMFGKHPQVFEPQLVITFLQYHGTSETERGPRGERFLDNCKFEGTIPEMVEATVSRVMASIRKSSLIDGLWRRDIPEYPEEVVREAVVNAVAHRDYSNFARGSHIQVRLFADRLEVQSPGGLHGTVTEETLEEEQSTRNRLLMRFLEDSHLAENRGTGIRAMIDAMRRANLEPPRFQDKRSSFWVTFRNCSLMTPTAVEWLNRFADRPMNDRQRLALVYLRNNDRMTNSDYQRLCHIDSVTATRELRGLVQSGLVAQHGTRRWTYYTPAVPIMEKADRSPRSEREMILAYVRQHGSIGNTECRRLLNIGTPRACYVLTRMCDKGLLRMVGKKKGAKYVLP